MRRIAAAVLLVGTAICLGAASAEAHALVRSSEPANGSVLASSPRDVVITWTEPPDPSLSTIEVLDQSGQNVAGSDARPVPGKPSELEVAVPQLGDGVYTVTWRTVSTADGHTTAGSFTFGVGDVSQGQVNKGGSGVSVPKSPSPPPLAVAGRWALYWALALLFAAAVARFVVFRGALPLRTPVLAGACAVGVAGLAAMILAERSSAGVSFSRLFASSSGHHLLREAMALGATILAVGIAVRWRSAWSVALVGAAAAATMLMHALNSHASASSPVWFNEGDQWLHLLAVATWVGGLVWLLIGIRDRADAERTSIAARFSWLAGIALAVVAATGIVRAIDEVGPPPDWRRLFDTSFGITLLVKLGLFAALVVFGARNRYVNVPGLTRGTRPVGSLRRALTAEIVLAAGILGATGLLSELPPSSAVAQTGRASSNGAPHPVVATGHDFATSVKVRLVVTPGTVGPNRFTATVDDFDTGRPVPATDVTLNFGLPGHPEIGRPTLDLQRRGSSWTGSGTVLSMFGLWDVSLVVQQPTGGVEVPLHVQTRLPEQEPPQVAPGTGNQPTVFTISLPGGESLQTYSDPGKAGRNAVHFTFFQGSGKELAIASAVATEIAPSGATRSVKLIRFDKGHFVANVTLRPGKWTFLIDATQQTGSAFSAYFTQSIA